MPVTGPLSSKYLEESQEIHVPLFFLGVDFLFVTKYGINYAWINNTCNRWGFLDDIRKYVIDCVHADTSKCVRKGWFYPKPGTVKLEYSLKMHLIKKQGQFGILFWFRIYGLLS